MAWQMGVAGVVGSRPGAAKKVKGFEAAVPAIFTADTPEGWRAAAAELKNSRWAMHQTPKRAYDVVDRLISGLPDTAFGQEVPADKKPADKKPVDQTTLVRKVWEAADEKSSPPPGTPEDLLPDDTDDTDALLGDKVQRLLKEGKIPRETEAGVLVTALGLPPRGPKYEVDLPGAPDPITTTEEYEKFRAGLSEDVIAESMQGGTKKTRDEVLKALYKLYLSHPDDPRFSFMKK